MTAILYNWYIREKNALYNWYVREKNAQSLSACSRSFRLPVLARWQTLLQMNLPQIREKVWVLILFKPLECKRWRKATTALLLRTQVQELPSTLQM